MPGPTRSSRPSRPREPETPAELQKRFEDGCRENRRRGLSGRAANETRVAEQPIVAESTEFALGAGSRGRRYLVDLVRRFGAAIDARSPPSRHRTSSATTLSFPVAKLRNASLAER